MTTERTPALGGDFPQGNEPKAPARDEGERTNEGVDRHADGRIDIAAACMSGHIVHLGLAEALVLERRALESDLSQALAALSPAQTGGTAVAWGRFNRAGKLVGLSFSKPEPFTSHWKALGLAAPVAEGAREDSGSLQPQDAASVSTEQADGPEAGR